MEKYNVVSFDSDSTSSLDQMVGSFLTRNEVKVINVSHSSCYDIKTERIIFSISVAYCYED